MEKNHVRTKAHIWLRDEDRSTERRTALTPKNAKILLDAGFQVTVEASDKRAFANGDYEAAGCTMAARAPGSMPRRTRSFWVSRNWPKRLPSYHTG